MRYFYKNNEYFFIGFDYNPALVASIKKFAGAGFNPQNKEWYVPIRLQTLNEVKSWLREGGFVEEKVYRPSDWFLNYREAPQQVTPQDILEGCSCLGLKRIPRNYQAEGIAYMMNHGNCINGDDCGSGKTGMSVCLVELMDVFPCLIICPSSVKYNWKKEWAQWNPSRSVGVIDTKKKKNDDEWVKDVVVINYDLLGVKDENKLKVKFKELLRRRWGSCIIDEIHFLKNEKALRTRMASKICGKIPHVWGLTGTLTQNKPSELISPYRVLRRFKDMFGEAIDFKFRYCNAHYTDYGFDYSGFSNLEELHKLLKMGGYIRRNKRDIMKELPPVTEKIVDAPLTNQREYTKAERDLISYLEKIDVEKASNAANAPHLVMLQTLKRLSIEGKLKFIEKYIQEWLDANEESSLVVFGTHRDPLQYLAEHFKADLIQGGVSSQNKQKIVDRFIEGKCRVLFANIQSAGTGVDGLQKVCNNLFYIELPDRYTDLEQATARLERMGQQNPIEVTFLLSPDTIDKDIWDVLNDKKLVTGVINTGGSEDQLISRKFYLHKHERKEVQG